ncbi:MULTISPECIES: hypothetical protein [Enterobacteriaceae]|uniref:hypothetical protein n=1 Tax=Enterobacteriaceae TaxID=543 RepID=UPI00112FB596|nr:MULTISPECIES: hypothetical protein [Enterobacteriaceae]
MSYYNKHVHSASRLLVTDEKEVMQALVTAELEAYNLNSAKTDLKEIKAEKKHSSASLLRRKLKATLVREFQDV